MSVVGDEEYLARGIGGCNQIVCVLSHAPVRRFRGLAHALNCRAYELYQIIFGDNTLEYFS